MTEADLFVARAEGIVIDSARQLASTTEVEPDSLQSQRACSWLLHIQIFAELMSAAVNRPGVDLEQTSAKLRGALLEAGQQAREQIAQRHPEPQTWPDTAYLGILRRLSRSIADSWKKGQDVQPVQLAELAARAVCLGLRGPDAARTSKGSWLVSLELLTAALRLRDLVQDENRDSSLAATLLLVNGVHEGAIRLLHTHLPLPVGQEHGDLVVIGFMHVAVSAMLDVGNATVSEPRQEASSLQRARRIVDQCDERLRLLGAMGAEETDELLKARWSPQSIDRLQQSLIPARPPVVIDLQSPFGRTSQEGKVTV